jgi:methyltransferase (TIGR00027 family)
MVTSEPSRTALITAHARAYHQIADRPVIFTDPLAVPLLGVTERQLHELSTRTDDPLAAAITDQPRRLFFAARARFAEDAIVAAVANGTRQLVILGAGLDTFAYRDTTPDLRVFEIDHPATQQWKRERITSAGVAQPPSLTFIPVDFEKDDLASALEATAFSRDQPAIFICLGVIFYLATRAVYATLEFIARQHPPVEVVFDYLQSPNTDQDRAHLRARSDRLAAVGESFSTYFAPIEIANRLTALDFTGIQDVAAQDAINAYRGETTNYTEESSRTLRASRLLRASR